MPATFSRVPSPVGELVLAVSGPALTGVYFSISRHGPPPIERAGWMEDDGRGPAGELLARTRQELAEYFAGTRRAFDVPMDPPGTAFQQRVWDALRDRKSTRLNSSHGYISYAVFCLKKKNYKR